MAEQGKNPTDAFALIVGPVALDQAEKALAKAIINHVARVAIAKLTRTIKTVTIIQSEGHSMLIDLAVNIYGITPAEAEAVIDDGIEKARHSLRKAV